MGEKVSQADRRHACPGTWPGGSICHFPGAAPPSGPASAVLAELDNETCVCFVGGLCRSPLPHHCRKPDGPVYPHPSFLYLGLPEALAPGYSPPLSHALCSALPSPSELSLASPLCLLRLCPQPHPLHLEIAMLALN